LFDYNLQERVYNIEVVFIQEIIGFERIRVI